jgi:hypothetical protein
MAQKIRIELIDDLDGSTAAETIKFGIDSTHYDIDLSEKNAAKLRTSLGSFVAAGRRTGGRQVARSTTKKTPGNTSAVRSWAAANGHKVSDRGRIPLAVQEAYDKASK